MIIDTVPELKKLSNPEKLSLINELWDSLSLRGAIGITSGHLTIFSSNSGDTLLNSR